MAPGSYDAESRTAQLAEPVSLGGSQMTYIYDSQDRRVEKLVNNVASTVYVYDSQGQLAAEYAATAAPAALCQTCYLSNDHLGSTRMVTDGSGHVVARHDYLPFGDEIVNAAGRTSLWGASDAINQKFTGKEHDAESGLDYFGARYYGSALGRFTSPDPLLNSGRPDDPQSWNRYTYALNNPLAITDPTGLYNLVNNCESNNKVCNKDFNTSAKNLKNAISALTKAVNGLKDGDQKTTLSASLKRLELRMMATMSTFSSEEPRTTPLHKPSRVLTAMVMSVSQSLLTRVETRG